MNDPQDITLEFVFNNSTFNKTEKSKICGEIWWNFWEYEICKCDFIFLAPLCSGIAFYNVDGWSISKSNRVAGDNC